MKGLGALCCAGVDRWLLNKADINQIAFRFGSDGGFVEYKPANTPNGNEYLLNGDLARGGALTLGQGQLEHAIFKLGDHALLVDLMGQ